MFKFEIGYFVDKDHINADDVRIAKVFAESLEGAVEKIKKIDPSYAGIASVKSKEYPHWKVGDQA